MIERHRAKGQAPKRSDRQDHNRFALNRPIRVPVPGFAIAYLNRYISCNPDMVSDERGGTISIQMLLGRRFVDNNKQLKAPDDLDNPFARRVKKVSRDKTKDK